MMRISRAYLRAAKHENLLRLAKFLRLRKTGTMSKRQLVNLIYWRITREEKARRGMVLEWR